jgi:hypothetical protein
MVQGPDRTPPATVSAGDQRRKTPVAHPDWSRPVGRPRVRRVLRPDTAGPSPGGRGVLPAPVAPMAIAVGQRPSRPHGRALRFPPSGRAPPAVSGASGPPHGRSLRIDRPPLVPCHRHGIRARRMRRDRRASPPVGPSHSGPARRSACGGRGSRSGTARHLTRTRCHPSPATARSGLGQPEWQAGFQPLSSRIPAPAFFPRNRQDHVCVIARSPASASATVWAKCAPGGATW